MKKSVARIFDTKSLTKPGGQIYRTISSLPSYITTDELIEYANKYKFGHRIENGVIRIFVPS
jgi:hypothetical protein